MGFFSDRRWQPPPERPEPELPEWLGPPDDILPGQSNQRAILVHTDDAVLVVDRFAAYSNGFTFYLTAKFRNPGEVDHFPWEIESRHGKRVDELPDSFVRLGIVFSDGAAWSNLDPWVPRELEEGPKPPYVSGRGGGGSDRGWDQRMWVWPLPPEGPLTFIVAWPSQGIAEAAFELDATELRQRADQAEQLWPGSVG